MGTRSDSEAERPTSIIHSETEDRHCRQHAMKHARSYREHRGTLFALFAFLVAHAAPQPAQAQGVDHSIFTTLLQTHVTEEGLVDYDAFATSEAFDEYLALLDQIDPASLSRNGQLALWLNAYNAWTIELINLHDERESIRNINKTLGIAIKGPWTQPLAKVGGVTYTLDDIEHGDHPEGFQRPAHSTSRWSAQPSRARLCARKRISVRISMTS